MRLIVIVDVSENVPAKVEPLGGRCRRLVHFLVTQEQHFAVERVQVVVWTRRENLVRVFAPRIVLIHLEVYLSDQGLVAAFFFRVGEDWEPCRQTLCISVHLFLMIQLQAQCHFRRDFHHERNEGDQVLETQTEHSTIAANFAL